MTPELIATVLTGAGVLIGVWKMVDGVRRELRADIATLNTRIDTRIDNVSRDLTAQITAVNTRIDNVLLADRKGPAGTGSS